MYCICSSSIRACLYIHMYIYTKINNIEIVARHRRQWQIVNYSNNRVRALSPTLARPLLPFENFRFLDYFSCFIVLFIIFFYWKFNWGFTLSSYSCADVWRSINIYVCLYTQHIHISTYMGMSVSACSRFRSIFLEIRVYERQHIITTSNNHSNNNSNSDKSNNKLMWQNVLMLLMLLLLTLSLLLCSDATDADPTLSLSLARTHCFIVRRAWISFEIINMNNLKNLFTTALSKKRMKKK